MNARATRASTLSALAPAATFALLSILLLGIAYPLLVGGIAMAIFPHQAAGSLVTVDGEVTASDLIGQTWRKPAYFHGRPSAAGKGYDPTSTGGTNLGPTSKALLKATAAALAAVRKENPDAKGPVPMDLVTSSASGVDPDISPDAAFYQVPRIAKARGLTERAVAEIVAAHARGRELGFLGEPRVNVLELNLALDGKRP